MEKELREGDPAPDFSLSAGDGSAISLADFRGKQDVVLYFYPKDDTPGCTIESCAFRDRYPQFTGSGAAILGVSLDSIESHQKFARKYSLPFPLLSDPDAKVSKAYGVYRKKSMYGREQWGIERSTFVVGRDGRIRKIFRRVKVEGHLDEVKEALAGK